MISWLAHWQTKTTIVDKDKISQKRAQNGHCRIQVGKLLKYRSDAEQLFIFRM